jgi:hypothetical protein
MKILCTLEEKNKIDNGKRPDVLLSLLKTASIEVVEQEDIDGEFKRIKPGESRKLPVLKSNNIGLYTNQQLVDEVARRMM